jgi:hypothetical protein
MDTKFLNDNLGVAGLVDFSKKTARVWEATSKTDFSQNFPPKPDLSFKAPSYVPEPPIMPKPPKLPELLDLKRPDQYDRFAFIAGLKDVPRAMHQQTLQARESFALEVERTKPRF